MTQPETEIRRAWRHIAGHQCDGYIDDVLIRYQEPHRHYHTVTHVMFVVRHLHDIARASSVAPTPEVVAAALYHDAIYDTTAVDNEASSARLASLDLAEIGWAPDRCEHVVELIMATAHLTGEVASTERAPMDPPDDRAMLLDADLAILGADPAAYQAYVNGVRTEYAHVDDNQWRTGRTAVLSAFLGRDRLFRSEFMHSTLDHRARANINAELATMRRG
jgi:predicted metal-dependent HD superfamily phosphohydrolase